MGKEIAILAFFAVCLLLFLSNAGVCGAAGEAVHRVLIGVFGVLGYVFPVYLFVAVLFYYSNRKNPKAIAKLAASAGLFVVLGGLISLVTTNDFDPALTVGQYYQNSIDSPGGGAMGGIFLKLLCPYIGKIGAYVVAIVLVTIGLVFITEKSILKPIEKGGRRVYDSAREDAARRREIHAVRAEEKRRYRLEKKVSGVALDTKLAAETDEEPAAEEEPVIQVDASEKAAPDRTAAQGSSLVRPTRTQSRTENHVSRMPEQEAEPAEKPEPEPEPAPIRITGLGYSWEEKEDAPQEEQSWEERPEPPVIPISGDALRPRRETRTLAELEALDSLHENIFSGRGDSLIWHDNENEESSAGNEAEIADKIETEPLQLNRIRQNKGMEPKFAREEMPDFAEKSESVPPAEFADYAEDAPEDISGWMELEREEKGETQARPDTRPDTRRVVTATGKVVEVDIDPDDDPLTRKRMENRQAQMGAAPSAREGVSPYAGQGRQNTSFTGNTAFAGTQGTPKTAAGMGAVNGRAMANGTVNGTVNGTLNGASNGMAAASGNVSSAPKKRPPRPYVRPPFKLLKAGDRNQRRSSDKELRETARKLENTLRNFGVGVSVTNISCGPTVTRYELQPEQGVRVSKIVGLADDIKLNLAAADIRIEAPIPGKASVGIEVPNKENATVYLRDVLESQAFRSHPSKLAFAVGQDISGEIIVTDLAKMPHLLIAGATGSGKSVCINTLIMSVLYKAKPEEVRLIMVDPKVVELSVYNGIPHLMIPVVTDPKKAAGALNWAVAEMTDRYRKFADWNVRDLKGYNEKITEEARKNGEEAEPLPQIVIIVDELSDLMMVCPGDVEDAICRLAQMARAAGIHLVLATQRPSVNVITGLIKANVPSRIAFSVSSGVDSRTIIDMNGAEKLLGKGDMLFYPSGYQKPVRVQGAFVSDTEVAAVVDYVTEHNDSCAYESAVEARMASAEKESGAAGGGDSGRDEYFAEAGRFIIEKQKASIGMLQRMFKIGFNRAARIMDQLAEVGVVSAETGTKAREILMDMNQYEQLLQSLGL